MVCCFVACARLVVVVVCTKTKIGRVWYGWCELQTRATYPPARAMTALGRAAEIIAACILAGLEGEGAGAGWERAVTDAEGRM